jgi:hypothetical protein
MGNWIKQNLVLVAGIVLPVLLVAGFLVLQGAPRILAGPPQYDFMVVGYRYDAQHPRSFHLSFEVRDGRLQGRATPTQDGNTYPNRQHAGIFHYSAANNSFTELAYDLPEGLDDIEEPVTFIIDEVAEQQFDKANRSPDGFVFEYAGYRGRGGLLGEMFGMGRRYDSNYVLNKNGAIFDLPSPASAPYYYGHDLHFMGWVIGVADTP